MTYEAVTTALRGSIDTEAKRTLEVGTDGPQADQASPVAAPCIDGDRPMKGTPITIRDYSCTSCYALDGATTALATFSCPELFPVPKQPRTMSSADSGLKKDSEVQQIEEVQKQAWAETQHAKFVVAVNKHLESHAHGCVHIRVLGMSRVTPHLHARDSCERQR